MTKFALKNPVSVIVLAVLLFITGLMSFTSMRRESFPEIKIPYIYVTTVYAGANPPEVENLITQKIEDKLDGVDGVKEMTSSRTRAFPTSSWNSSPRSRWRMRYDASRTRSIRPKEICPSTPKNPLPRN